MCSVPARQSGVIRRERFQKPQIDGVLRSLLRLLVLNLHEADDGRRDSLTHGLVISPGRMSCKQSPSSPIRSANCADHEGRSCVCTCVTLQLFLPGTCCVRSVSCRPDSWWMSSRDRGMDSIRWSPAVVTVALITVASSPLVTSFRSGD
jgi:hypothetical protein